MTSSVWNAYVIISLIIKAIPYNIELNKGDSSGVVVVVWLAGGCLLVG